jgi:hypothetical protein
MDLISKRSPLMRQRYGRLQHYANAPVDCEDDIAQ